jgi:hypothetical protein
VRSIVYTSVVIFVSNKKFNKLRQFFFIIVNGVRVIITLHNGTIIILNRDHLVDMCTGNLIKNLSSYNKLYPKRYTERSNKKKIRVGENGGLNQSKHQNSTIQVARFFFKLIAR